MLHIEYVLLASSALLLLAVLAGKASDRVGIPPLLLFLAIGMLAGSEGPGGIYFDDAWLAQLVGVIALTLILFASGLDTHWPEVRPALWPALSLATLGVAITAVAVGWFVTLILSFSWIEGVLLGAIVSATDAAAVLSVLSMNRVRLTGRLAPLLELESGTNDPMAVFLTIGLTHLLIDAHTSTLSLIPLFLREMVVGAALGVGMGKGIVPLVSRLHLDVSGAYPVLTTALALFAFGATASLGGSGFLAVYLVGLIVGNSDVRERPSLVRFHGGLASLMEIAMFLTLGLLVFPSRLVTVAGAGLLVTLFLIVIARPLSVFVSLVAARLRMRDKAFVSWMGLRGAVPIVLATFPLLEGVPRADLIFDVVFFTVLASLLVQGTTIPLAARVLKVAAPDDLTT